MKFRLLFLFFLGVSWCRELHADSYYDSLKTMQYKGIAMLGFNYNLAGKADYVYGKYSTFNAQYVSFSNGILIKNQFFAGIKTDIHKINETIFFPIALELAAKIAGNKRNALYADMSAGYGLGKTNDRINALNWFYSSKLVFHFDVGFIYEYRINQKLSLLAKINYNKQYFKSYEYSGHGPISDKRDYYITFRNIGLNFGISF